MDQRIREAPAASARGGSILVNLSSMADFDDEDHVRWLNDVDDPPVLDAQPSGAFEAVAQGLSELYGVGD